MRHTFYGMDAAHTLRVVAQRVDSRISEAGVSRADLADKVGVAETDLARPSALTVAQLVSLSLVIEAEPADFFPAAVTRTGVTA